jgi:hypothetical protein
MRSEQGTGISAPHRLQDAYFVKRGFGAGYRST